MDFKVDLILSIIIPTIGRKYELKALLNSILNLDHCNYSYEIIIIDQNISGYLNEILTEYSIILNIRYFNVNFKGLSKAKNFGIKVSKGKYLCFPDDDCEFFNDTIYNAFKILFNYNLDIVFGKCIDKNGQDTVLKFKKEESYLSSQNMDGGFVEATVFSKREVFEKVNFDETMGAGCFHGAEEGYDWLYRVLKFKNFRVLFSPEIKFYHPAIIQKKGDDASIKRVFTYRCGYAKLCYKHRFYFKYFKRLIFVLILLPFLLIFNFGKFKYYSAEALGLLTGIIIK